MIEVDLLRRPIRLSEAKTNLLMTRFIAVGKSTNILSLVTSKYYAPDDQIPFSHEFVNSHTGPIMFSRNDEYLSNKVQYSKLLSREFILSTSTHCDRDESSYTKPNMSSDFLSQMFNRLSSTTSLTIKNHQYGTRNDKPLIDFILKASQLQSLTIDKETFALDGAYSPNDLIRAFNYHKSITHLCIGDIFCSRYIQHTSTLLRNYNNLTTLELTDVFYDESAYYEEEMTRVLASMSGLNRLVIRAKCPIERGAIQQLMEIMTNPSLTSVSLSPLRNEKDWLRGYMEEYREAFNLFMFAVPDHLTRLELPATHFTEQVLPVFKAKNLKYIDFADMHLMGPNPMLTQSLYNAIKESSVINFPSVERYSDFKELLDYKRYTDKQTVHKILIDLGIVFFKNCLIQPYNVVEIFIHAYDPHQFNDRKFIAATLTKLYGSIDRLPMIGRC